MKTKDVLLTCIRFNLGLVPEEHDNNIICVYKPGPTGERIGYIDKKSKRLEFEFATCWKYADMTAEELCNRMVESGFQRSYNNPLSEPDTQDGKIYEIYKFWTMNPNLPSDAQMEGIAEAITQSFGNVPLCMSTVGGCVVLAYLNEHGGVTLYTK